MDATLYAVGIGVSVLGAIAVRRIARGAIRGAVERKIDDAAAASDSADVRADAVATIQAVQIRVMRIGALFGVGAAGTVASTGLGGAGSNGWSATPPALALLGACALLPLIAARGIVRSAVAHVRGLSVARNTRLRYLASRLLQTVVLLAPVPIALRLGSTLALRVFLLAVLYTFAAPALIALLAPALVRILGGRKLPSHENAQLTELAGRLEMAVPVGRVIHGADIKCAAGAVIGFLPRLRYVVVTDYLLANAAPNEFRAVMAHELGHIRLRHAPIRLMVRGASLGSLIIGEVAVFSATSNGLVFVAGMVAAVVLMRRAGAVVRQQEQAADDVAVECVGGPSMTAALVRICRLNDRLLVTAGVGRSSANGQADSARIARLQVPVEPEPLAQT